MDSLSKFVADVSSWYWWVSVVILGFVLNIGSSYTKSILDRAIERHSKQRREKLNARKAKLAVEIEILLNDPRLIVLQGTQQVRFLLISVSSLVLALAFGALAFRIVNSGFPASVAFVMSFIFVIVSMATQSISFGIAGKLESVETAIRESSGQA